MTINKKKKKPKTIVAMRRKLIENNKSFDAVGYMLMNLADSSEPSEQQQFNNDESDYEALHIFQDKPQKKITIFLLR